MREHNLFLKVHWKLKIFERRKRNLSSVLDSTEYE